MVKTCDLRPESAGSSLGSPACIILDGSLTLSGASLTLSVNWSWKLMLALSPVSQDHAGGSALTCQMPEKWLNTDYY